MKNVKNTKNTKNNTEEDVVIKNIKIEVNEKGDIVMKNTKGNKQVKNIQKFKQINLLSTKASLVVTPNMTAIEALRVANRLKEVAEDMILNVANECYCCTDFNVDGDCEACKEVLEKSQINIPSKMLKVAGIDENENLIISADEKQGVIFIEGAGYSYNILDVADWIKDVYEISGVCLSSLEELIREGNVVKVC